MKAREKAREKERERKKATEKARERERFCVINVKYKEMSWRIRKKEEEEKSNF